MRVAVEGSEPVAEPRAHSVAAAERAATNAGWDDEDDVGGVVGHRSVPVAFVDGVVLVADDLEIGGCHGGQYRAHSRPDRPGRSSTKPISCRICMHQAGLAEGGRGADLRRQAGGLHRLGPVEEGPHPDHPAASKRPDLGAAVLELGV
jgi:hypothetical protein